GLKVSSKAGDASEATRRTTMLKRCRDMNTYKRCPSRGHCKPLPSREKRATASASCVSRRLLLEFGTSPAKGLAQAALGHKARANPRPALSVRNPRKSTRLIQWRYAPRTLSLSRQIIIDPGEHRGASSYPASLL